MEIENYYRASYPALYLVAREEMRAIEELNELAKQLEVSCSVWTVTEGWQSNGHSSEATDPLAALSVIPELPEGFCILVNFHFYLGDPQIIQRVKDLLPLCKSTGRTICIVSARLDIPVELEKEFAVLEFTLPDEAVLERTVRTICSENDITLPNNLHEIVQAGLGLTQSEFENALALSIVQSNGKIDATVIREQKSQLVQKNSALSFSNFSGGFETIAGLENVKAFAKKMVMSGKGRGILLLGVPGTGKSHFSKTLGNETGRPTIALDFGLLMSSYVGESEAKTKGALDIVDAMSPCVLFIDEIEKGLAGVSKNSYVGDSGVSQRQGGIFLRWLSDHESDVYVIATCNDISKMPAEYLRAERWDAVFFVDLPNEQEREAIFTLYKKMYGVKGDAVDMTNWSGAEIRSICRLADAMQISLKEASTYIVPLYDSMKEDIQRLREWAKTRTVPASKQGCQTKKGRKIRVQ